MRRANLPDGRKSLDIDIQEGRTVAVEANPQTTATQELNVSGRLVSPPFVDAHFRMDATLT